MAGFVERARKVASEQAPGVVANGLKFVAEPKLDGISVALRYRDGELEWCATRGDGHYGEDVTETVRRVQGVPATLRRAQGIGSLPPPPLLEVRGELCMSHKALARLNAEREGAGLPALANARNAAAGVVNQHEVHLLRP